MHKDAVPMLCPTSGQGMMGKRSIEIDRDNLLSSKGPVENILNSLSPFCSGFFPSPK